MSRPQIPVVGDILGPAIARLVELRPSVAQHIQSGRYGDVLTGWRGQYERARADLVEHTAAARLSTSGQALTDLASSEFDISRVDEPVTSIGEVTLVRAVVHLAIAASATANAIAAPDASDEASLQVLINAIAASYIAHRASIYDSATGLGAHQGLDAVNNVVPVITLPYTLSAYKTAVNNQKLLLVAHFGALDAHKDADALSTISITDAVATTKVGGGSDWASATPASQQSILRVANACKAAFNKHAGLVARAGTIRAGSRWTVRAEPSAVPPIKGAEYEAIQDVVIGVGQQTVVPRIQAIRPGAHANLPSWAAGAGPSLSIVSGGALFDASASLPLAATAIAAAGGSDGQSDEELRRAAQANFAGRDGPTTDATVAGTLNEPGSARVLVLRNTSTAVEWLYAVDASWAQSAAWRATIARRMKDEEWLGWGCRLATGLVQNQPVRVELTVALRHADDLVDTAPVLAAIQAELRRYFDDRLDWHLWRAAGIKAAVSRADRRVLVCSSVTLRDGSGLPLTEPPVPTAGDTLTHFWFADNALDASFVAPA